MKCAYHAVIEQDGDLWTAFVREVPGCRTQAASIDELVKSKMRETLSLFVDNADKAQLEFRIVSTFTVSE